MADKSLSEWFYSMPRITVIGDVNRRKITSKKTGEEISLSEQAALLKYEHVGQEIALPVSIRLDRDQQPYRAGDYMLAGASLDRNQFGGLELNRFRLELQPVPDPILRLVEQDRERARKAA